MKRGLQFSTCSKLQPHIFPFSPALGSIPPQTSHANSFSPRRRIGRHTIQGSSRCSSHYAWNHSLHDNIHTTRRHAKANINSRSTPSFSSSFSTASQRSEDTEPQSPKPPVEVSLKQVIRPFLMKFHPDRQGISSDANNNTTIAREVNLHALQTLNGMIDTIEQIHARASQPSKASARGPKGRIELQNTYTIEFLVSSENRSTGASHTAVKKRREVPSSSRRSVELAFSNREINSVQMVDQNGRYSVKAAEALKWKAMSELGKLLRVAGLQISNDLRAQMDRARSNSGSLLEEELSFGLGNQGREQDGGIHGRKFQYGTPRPKTAFEESRERFMKSVDWKKFNKVYDEALEDMERDLATDGLISMNEERKQRLVAEVISKVRIFDESDARRETGDDANVDEEDAIDPVSQLIAIRRLSLLLNDNFDELEMEEMGRLWESMVIVLKNRDNPHDDQGKTGLPFSRLKRLKKGKESGFKFAFHSDDRVTVYVPIDFLDDEFLGEMKVHLADFYSLCLSKGELEDHFPSYYSDFKGQANFDD